MRFLAKAMDSSDKPTFEPFLQAQFFGKARSNRLTKGRRNAASRSRSTCYDGTDYWRERELRHATNRADHDAVRRLLQSGVDVRAADDKGRTALHIAAAKGDADVVKLLLSRGADPNQRDDIGNTGLHLAVCSCHVDTVTALLKGGTSVDEQDLAGRTPLHLARARLRLLSRFAREKGEEEGEESGGKSSFVLVQEVGKVCEMLKTYLHVNAVTSTKVDSDLDELTSLFETLSANMPVKNVDEMQNVLSGLTSMKLK